MEIYLHKQLELPKCPHCHVVKPLLDICFEATTHNHSGSFPRNWKVYKCSTCGGLVTAFALEGIDVVVEFYPKLALTDTAIPDPARTFLTQAIDSLHTPAGAVMLAASSVDAMLKTKGYKDGTLYTRINKAVEDHLITSEMAKWAHEIRLDANEQRHADENALLPSDEDAKKCVDFANALGEFLFVLPARVARGLKEAKD